MKHFKHVEHVPVSTHVPVLINEVVEFLDVKPGQWYCDATLGAAGHTQVILAAGGNVVGIDRDPEAIKRATDRLVESRVGRQLTIQLGRFSDLATIVRSGGIEEVAGVVFDLGYSSDQLEDSERGFSFMKPGPLDMRMDQNLGVSAADLINGMTKIELSEMFRKYGESKLVNAVTKEILKIRDREPIQTTTQLAEVIESVFQQKGRFNQRIHPATTYFQALRIVVNDELGQLEEGLSQALEILALGGKLVVISFHSLEDRIVKRYMKSTLGLEVITKRPIRASVAEIEDNPRSRSAKLRVAERK